MSNIDSKLFPELARSVEVGVAELKAIFTNTKRTAALIASLMALNAAACTPEKPAEAPVAQASTTPLGQPQLGACDSNPAFCTPDGKVFVPFSGQCDDAALITENNSMCVPIGNELVDDGLKVDEVVNPWGKKKTTTPKIGKGKHASPKVRKGKE